MRTLKISKSNFDGKKYKKGLIDFKGHVEIASELGSTYFDSIKASGHVLAGRGTDVVVTQSIVAGQYIHIGGELRVGNSVQAGEAIIVDGDIWVLMRIFAGLVTWRLPRPDEIEIRCRSLLRGNIAYGELIETGESNG